jgi:hypothetical protein
MKKKKQIYLVKKIDANSDDGYYFVVCKNQAEAMRAADTEEEIYTADNLKKIGKTEMVIR